MNNEEQTTPTTVDVSLTQQQAELVQDLLANYTYAYRSDQDTDCKRELVPKDKVGTFPYVVEAPAPDMQNPVYDWTLAKWVDQDAQANATRVAQLTEKVDQLAEDQKTFTANGDDMATDIKAMKESSQAQTQILMQLMQMMKPVTPSTDADDTQEKEEGAEDAK